MVAKPTNARKCLKGYYTNKYREPPVCFGHSSGHPQGGALHRMAAPRYYRSCEPVHRRKIPSFKNTWFGVHQTVQNTDRKFVINYSV